MDQTSGRSARRWAGPALRAALLAGCIGVGAPAWAEDATGERAQQLEQQVRAWLATLLGPRANLADRPVHITADGDRFRVEVPVNDLFATSGITVSGDPISAVARPLDGGRWAIDDIRFPSPLRAAYQAGGGANTLTATADEQTQHAVLDPSLATSSSWDGMVKGYASRTEGPQGTQSTRLETLTSHMVWQPAEGGRLNVLQEIQGGLLTVNSMVPKVGLVAFSAERMRGTVHMENVTPERVAPVLHAMFELAPLAMAAADAATDAKQAPPTRPRKPGASPRPTPSKPAEARPRHHDAFKLTAEVRASLHAALVAARDLTDGFGEQVTLENLRVEAGDHGGRAARMVAGLGVDAPGGRLSMRMNFALDGLDSPAIPPGVYRDYLPRHIAFAPRLGGVPAKDFMDLLLRAVDSDGHDPALEAQAEELMRKGPFAVGLDELALDFGPATLKGSGEMQVTGRDTYNGQAHFAATGMDALLRQANATPELGMAAPVLLMLKGLGQQDGDTLVWNIAYQGGKLTVNGNDMSQMMPGK